MDALLDRVLCRTEPTAYEALLKHLRSCKTCKKSHMCPKGLALHDRWKKLEASQGPHAA